MHLRKQIRILTLPRCRVAARCILRSSKRTPQRSSRAAALGAMPAAKTKAKSTEGGPKTKPKPTRVKENKRPSKRSPCTVEKAACNPKRQKSTPDLEEVEKTEPSNNTPANACKKRAASDAEESGNVEAAPPTPTGSTTIKRMRPRQQGGRVFPEEFFRERCGEASAAAFSYIERHAIYPSPVVGKLECAYVGFDVSKDAIKASTDIHFEWRYKHTCANGQVIQAATAHTKPADWLIYRKIAMLPPRAHVNACIAALILDRMVLKRAFVPFFAKVPPEHGIEVLAVGVAKPIGQLPETKSMRIKNRSHECIICAKVGGNSYIVHAGAKQRHGTCAYYCSALQEIDFDGNGAAGDDDDERELLKNRRKKNSHEFDLKGGRGPPPTALEEVNAPNGKHMGLRTCMAVAHLLAEIRRAKLESREVDINEACVRLERDPFAWQKWECTRLVLLWCEKKTDGLRMHHVATNSMCSLIRWCRGEKSAKSKKE